MPAVKLFCDEFVSPLLHKKSALTAFVNTLTVPSGTEQFVLSVEPQVAVTGITASLTVVAHVPIQPDKASVTVTVYIPADKPDIAFVVFPLLHKKVALSEFVITFAVPFGAIHELTSVEEQVAEIPVELVPTIASQVAVQPFVLSVTVTEYVPPAKPLIEAVVCPLLQIYVGFSALVVTLAEPFCVVQPVLSVAVQFAVGIAAGVFKISNEHVAEQPVNISVTVTVYTPGANPDRL